MSYDPLDSVLEELTAGDAAATEQVFRTYEPYLRVVVRRRMSSAMRAKFDSVDIVQSVWVHMLKSFRAAGYKFADAAHLRAFLVQLTHHRLTDRLRRHRRALEYEQSLDGADLANRLTADAPEPADYVQAEELWDKLLDLCPSQHREILRLKREGALTSEVAARTGLNAGSVRRILQTLSRRLGLHREKCSS
jgi:RNA polymerase sigma-70 factor (ECF subfamily)